MVNLQSPSVSISEQDSSQFATTSSATVAAFVGFATKGPIGVPTLVTSKKEFIETFGIPSTTAPWGHLGVYRSFNQSNQILYTRVADTTTSARALSASTVILNDSPALAGYQAFTSASTVNYGSFTSSGLYGFQATFNGTLVGAVNIAAPATGDWSLTDIATKINTVLTNSSMGYQELKYDFTSATRLSALTAGTYYRFNLKKDATASVVTTGDLEAYLTPSMTISDYITTISTAISQGSAPTSKIPFVTPLTGDITTATMPVGTGTTGFVFSGSQNYSIKIGGVEINVVLPAAAYTWQAFVNDLNTAITTYATANPLSTIATKAIRAFLDASGIVFTSNEYATAATTNVVVTAGVTSLNLLTVTGVLNATPASVAGVASTLTTTFTVGVDSVTKRLRISSLAPTSSSVPVGGSQINILSPSLGNLGPVANFAKANSIIVGFGGVYQPNIGLYTLQAGISAAVTNGKVRVSSGSTGVTSSVAIVADPVTALTYTAPTFNPSTTYGTATKATDLVTLLAVDTAVAGVAAVTASTQDNIEFYSIDTGSSNNSIVVTVGSTIDGFSGTTKYTIYVSYKGELKETFSDVSLVPSSSTFFATAINALPANGGSKYVNVAYNYRTVSPGAIKLAAGTYTLGTATGTSSVGTTAYDLTTNNYLGSYGYRVGKDGIPSVGGTALFVSALASDGALANMELYDFHILATPDNNAEETQNAALSLYNARNGDFIYVADPPFGKTYTQVTDWHNGKSGHGRTTALNTDGAAVYWPWLLEYNTYTEQNVWCPPSVFVVEKYIEIDNNYAPWAAVAGDTRGRVIAQGYETSPSQAQRDYMYGGLNAVNPIVNFNSKGLEIYGQKTAYRANSALNRVNVKRLMVYIKKLIRLAMMGFVFEANTTATLSKMTNFINSILEPVRQRNGLSSYKVTFTADATNPNLVNGVVKVVPVGTIEFININISVLPTGTTIS